MNSGRPIFFLIMFYAFISIASAQPGGRTTYGFLDIINDPKVIALGGKPVSAISSEPGLAVYNPALINATMVDQISLGYTNYIGDINSGYTSYVRNLKHLGPACFSINYFNYGSFVSANESGEKTGTFKASDVSLQSGFVKQFDSVYSAGINTKLIFSSFEQYNSVGMAFDLAGSFTSRDKLLSVSALVRNAGFQITRYSKNNGENLPFDVQLSLSQKLEHAPITFYLVAHKLNRPVLIIKDPSEPAQLVDPLTGDLIKQKKNIGENILRHLVGGIEFSPAKTFYLCLGFNYQRKRELSLSTRAGITGFSGGFGLKIAKFNLSYSRSAYHFSGAVNNFNITTRISDLINKSNRTSGL